MRPLRAFRRRLSRLAGQFWRDGGDIAPDFLDLVRASGSDHVARHGLGREHAGAQQADFELGARPFATVERLRRKLDCLTSAPLGQIEVIA